MQTCFDSVVVAFTEESEYSTVWYDRENDDGTQKQYTISIPARNGNLYLSVETYMWQMVPHDPKCMDDRPRVEIKVYKNG